MKLSVVTTLYKSRGFLEAFQEGITDVIRDLQISDYEIVYVNDGSPDESVSVLIEMQKTEPHIRIVDLSRNFGHHYALQAGIEFASGDYIYLADNDMETPVSFLKTCYEFIVSNPLYDLVYGVQEVRKGHFVERIGGAIFWHLFNALSDTKVPENILTECLMTHRFAEELLRMNDANLFLGGMIHWVGMGKKEIVVKKGQRSGASTYTLRKRLALMIQALTSFSGKPLEWLFYTGCSITGVSLLFLLYIIIKKIIMGSAVSIGWTSMVGIMTLSLGLISTFLGLIGLYVYRIYKQVQGRPNVIVKKIY